MKNSAFVIIMFLQVVLMTACGSSEPSYLKYGDVSYVTEFPHEYSLPEQEPFMSDMMGVVSVRGVDSLLIGINADQEYFMGLYSLNSGKKLADLFKRGQGPGEYVSSPRVQKFIISGDSVMACMIYNYGKEIFTLDLLSSSKKGHEVVSKRSYPNSFHDIKDFIPLNRGDSFVVARNFDKGGFKRYIYTHDNRRQKIKVYDYKKNGMHKINDNIISFLSLPFKNDSLVAEACIAINQINIYSLNDTTIRKTVCVGSSLDDVRAVDRAPRAEIPRSYGGIGLWRDKPVFLYHGLTEKDYQENKGSSELQIFDAGMQPLIRIKLPIIATAFYLDDNGKLYLFNPLGDSEYVYRYDILEMLEAS